MTASSQAAVVERLDEMLLERYPESYRNAAGEVVVTEWRRRKGPESVHWTEVEESLTTRYAPGPRTTGSVERLVIEAELDADDERYIGNPARPVDAAVLEAARQRLEAKDLTPAWVLE